MSVEEIERDDVPEASVDTDEWRAVREDVLDRDGHACRFCGTTNEEHREEHGRGLHAHHIIPDGDGGPDSMRNLITVCQSCHRTLESTHARAISQLREEPVPRAEDRLNAVRGQIDDALSHARSEFKQATEEAEYLPPLEKRRVPGWWIDNLSEKEFTLYTIGRFEGIEFAARHIKSGLTKPEWGEEYAQENWDFDRFLEMEERGDE